MSNKSESHFFPKRGLTSTNPRQNVLGKEIFASCTSWSLLPIATNTTFSKVFGSPSDSPIFRYETHAYRVYRMEWQGGNSGYK